MLYQLAATIESPVCLDRMVRAQVCIYCNMLDAIKSWATKNHQNSEPLSFLNLNANYIRENQSVFTFVKCIDFNLCFGKKNHHSLFLCRDL